ncbi:DMT family transporter [Roseateles sp. DAIF2]|uniref:DMT family transporter n=1 Tax=Roseateles sp. DAIF2 TaxID=2714952 RepID=UPI0018A281B3|nr:DMT family transporter [Roseateles sp. DAIF2]QPF71906.1 DMT family transporter [Roseateles sp. DAIF2]
MFAGTLFALAAGLMWGLVFVAPLLLPDYPAALLTVGRYLAFGLIALPLALMDRRDLAQLTRADWLEALKLSAIGNFLYYLCLSAAIQRAGGPLPTVIIGTLPVVIAICSNLRDHERDGHLPWARLAPSLALIAAGIACVNQIELAALAGREAADLRRYAEGALLAVAAVACWTWYPIRNADWLRAHGASAPGRPKPDATPSGGERQGRSGGGRRGSPRAWATAQGLVTLPMALVGLALLPALQGFGLLDAGFALPLGPRPWAYVGLMLVVGLCASWLGTLCWNEASQRLPTALVGQLIVFETLAALAYAFLLRGRPPAALTLLGIALLVGGVVWALRVKPVTKSG